MRREADLRVQIAPGHEKGLLLPNPVLTASGTCGYGEELFEIFDVRALGGIICKGTTLRPRDGNPQPRIIEVAAGMLNSIGLQNIGIDALIKEKAPLWAKWQVPVIVNIAGDSIDEYAQIASRLEGIAGISGIEVNISCPNVSRGGMQFGTDPIMAAEVTDAVKEVSTLPVIIKLSPNVTDIVTIARSVSEAGADSISLINTVVGMDIDIVTMKPKLMNVYGGLSGPAIKPIALQMVYRVAGEVNIPIVGCGGIMNAEDALEFIMAGAMAVEVGTATLVNPYATLDIIDGIRLFLMEKGYKSIADIRGIAHA